jgi:hypothetical protein
MRSLLWTGVFVVLLVELALTLLLVIPFPRTLRNKLCRMVSKLELKKRLQVPLRGLFFVLLLALLDTAMFLATIYDTKTERGDAAAAASADFRNNPIDRHLLKEKEYKAGRNMYLVGFSLTLLFVIGRITELMQEHSELEGKLENLRLAASMVAMDQNYRSKQQKSSKTKSTKATATATAGDDNDAPTEGIEMKPIGLKKKD